MRAFLATLSRVLRAPFAWRSVHSAGVWAYRENAVTGERKIVRELPYGHQPRDLDWIKTGVFSERASPPTGRSAVARSRCAP